jgi:hypothetical protein
MEYLMPDSPATATNSTDQQREAAQVRLERDILYTLSKAEVSDIEVAMLLVTRKLAVDPSDSAKALPDGAQIETVLREVLEERPYLRKSSGREAPPPALSGSLPGALPRQTPPRPSAPTVRQEAYTRARSSRSLADLAEYLRLRRCKR